MRNSGTFNESFWNPHGIFNLQRICSLAKRILFRVTKAPCLEIKIRTNYFLIIFARERFEIASLVVEPIANNNTPISWLQDLLNTYTSWHLHQNNRLRCFFTACKVITFTHKSKFRHWRSNKLQKWFLRSTFICFEWALIVRRFSNRLMETNNHDYTILIPDFCDWNSLNPLLFDLSY